jgi:hypothetical protein
MFTAWLCGKLTPKSRFVASRTAPAGVWEGRAHGHASGFPHPGLEKGGDLRAPRQVRAFLLLRACALGLLHEGRKPITSSADGFTLKDLS